MKTPFAAAILLVSLALAAPASFAQIPDPAPEIERFDRYLGNWEGAGTSKELPDSPPRSWTAVSSVKKVAEGFAIQEDTTIDFGGPASFLVRNLYCWEMENKRLTKFSVTNADFGGYEPMYWVGENRLTGSVSRLVQGIPVAQRWVIDFATDSYTIRIDRSIAGGPFFTYVDGEFHRGGEGTSHADSGGEVLLPAPREMAVTAPAAGRWKFRGKYSPMPGIPGIDISGRSTTANILGGHCQFTVIEGAPTPPRSYRGLTIVAWDAEIRRYASLNVDNFGAANVETALQTGARQLTYTGTASFQGTPMATRSIVAWSSDGNRAEVVGHRAFGTDEPDQFFTLTQERE